MTGRPAMRLRYSQGVQDALRTFPPKVRRDLRAALELIAEDPRHPDLDLKALRKVAPFPFFRARVRQYRIIYSVHPGFVYVWRTQHRSEGYDWLDRMDPWREG